MDTTWQTVGVVMLMASVGTLGAITWRLLRADRRRSEARVAALAAAIDDVDLDLQIGNTASDGAATLPVVAPAGRPIGVGVVAVGLIAALVAVSGATAAWLDARAVRHQRSPAGSSRDTSRALELLSMRHARDGDTLIVSGIIRNPSTSATLPLTAVVSAVGHDGRRLARAESPLDPIVLQPGKETSFRVTLSSPDDPGRYRLSFTSGEQVVPHMDRRADLGRAAMAIE